MRKNLDPFAQHTDEELWNALREVRTDRVSLTSTSAGPALVLEDHHPASFTCFSAPTPDSVTESPQVLQKHANK